MNGTRWIVMDVAPPVLGCLKIYGKLTIAPNLNLNLSVTCVLVYGIFDISGGNGTAYSGQVNLQLYGTKSSAVPQVVGKSACFIIFIS